MCALGLLLPASSHKPTNNGLNGKELISFTKQHIGTGSPGLLCAIKEPSSPLSLSASLRDASGPTLVPGRGRTVRTPHFYLCFISHNCSQNMVTPGCKGMWKIRLQCSKLSIRERQRKRGWTWASTPATAELKHFTLSSTLWPPRKHWFNNLQTNKQHQRPGICYYWPNIDICWINVSLKKMMGNRALKVRADSLDESCSTGNVPKSHWERL